MEDMGDTGAMVVMEGMVVDWEVMGDMAMVGMEDFMGWDRFSSSTSKICVWGCTCRISCFLNFSK